jgi:Uma2 family endonuclease
MSAAPESGLSYEEYLARERTADFKSEFYHGEAFAMVGGSPRHNTIGVNLVTALRNQLKGTPCRPFNSDQRIRIPANGLATYPDISIVCGEFELDEQDKHAITNPVVLFEVLSNSTERYDRGKKFDLYRPLETFKEYVLVSQNEAHVERFLRQDDGSWVLNVIKGVDTTLPLASVNREIPLAVIYEDVEFGEPEE